MTTAICLEGVRFRYDDRVVLSNVHLSVDAGETLALLGPSGSGKTTVLRLVLGLEVPEAGAVRLGAETVSEAGRLLVPPEERGVAVVFQDLALWPHLTVRGNLAFGMAARGVRPREREGRISAMLERLSIGDKGDRYPGGLSGGERQRVAIARALVLQPRAILLDEPLSNLDVTLKRELVALFRDLLRENGNTALYVTHDLREAASLGDRIAVIESGRIVQVGSLDDLRAAPASPFVRNLIEDLGWPEALPRVERPVAPQQRSARSGNVERTEGL